MSPWETSLSQMCVRAELVCLDIKICLSGGFLLKLRIETLKSFKSLGLLHVYTTAKMIHDFVLNNNLSREISKYMRAYITERVLSYFSDLFQKWNSTDQNVSWEAESLKKSFSPTPLTIIYTIRRFIEVFCFHLQPDLSSDLFPVCLCDCIVI